MRISLRADILRAVGDVLINLSAAWLGAIFILPPLFDFAQPETRLILAMNFVAGIVGLASAIKLRRMSRSI